MSGSNRLAPLSILLICQTYPPVLGGSEIEAQRVSAELIRRGHHVQVVCAGGGPMPRVRNWLDPAGVPVRIYGGRWRGRARDLAFAVRVALMLLRERRQYQAVYFLMQGLHLALGLPLSRFLRKPIVMKVSGSQIFPQMASTAAGRLELRWLRRWAARVLVLNQGMEHEAQAQGFGLQQLEWMPNPVDTCKFRPCGLGQRTLRRRELGLPADALVVIYTGRLAPEKALPELLRGFAVLRRSHPQAVLVLVGDGAARPELERLAVQLGLDVSAVRFAGRQPPDAVPAWLQAADIFALVSPAEGFSCALAEAMACGLACVVTDIPANRQLVTTGKTGLLLSNTAPASMAAAIASLLDDSELRGRLGRAAREHIEERYTPGQVGDRYEILFRTVLEYGRGLNPPPPTLEKT